MFRNRQRAIFAILLTCCFLAYSVPAPAASEREYIIGDGDIVKITVYEHPDLTAVQRVSGDGTITMPLIGEVKVAGLSVSDLTKLIARRLADGYIISPQVGVFIEEFRSQRTVIMGEVVKPGLYELRGHTTFLELVSMAGGLTKDAGDTAIIKRKEAAGAAETIATISLQRLIELNDMSQNLAVVDGDSIYVNKAGLFYVTGEVRKPDAYKYRSGTTVIQAVTMAGGFTAKAAPSRLKIIRKVQGGEKIMTDVKLEEPVSPDDVIVVPESFF